MLAVRHCYFLLKTGRTSFAEAQEARWNSLVFRPIDASMRPHRRPRVPATPVALTIDRKVNP
jgi:hypothetical protein